MLNNLHHVGTDVLEDEIVYVLVPGQDPIKSQVIGVFDGMVFVEKDNDVMSWVNAEFIFSNAGVSVWSS
tara:strand:+ start:803 stop:1009 length:207 start_codon:yes stop_codon:yes gene_type:complete